MSKDVTPNPIFNYNIGMKIYFAGSIRGGREDRELYFAIIRLLQNYGEVLTEHVGDVGLISETDLDDKEIHERDLTWLRECDFVVAEVTQPSLGVGYELGRAVEWNKKVLCLYRPSEGKSLSAMIAGAENIDVHEYQDLIDLHDVFVGHFQ